MFITNTTVFGGRGFSVGGGGVLKTASGAPPLTLEKTLAKPPEDITVYGETGGVGDKTANLIDMFNPTAASGCTITRNSFNAMRVVASGSSKKLVYSFTPEPSTKYYITGKSYNIVAGQGGTIGVITVTQSGTQYVQGRPYGNSKQPFTTNSTTDPVSIEIIVSGGYGGTTVDFAGLYVYKSGASVTYEPYGYKIPILINPPILPSGYTKLEYIESTGTQCLNTGISSDNNNINIEIQYELTETIPENAYKYLVGAARAGLGDVANTTRILFYGSSTRYICCNTPSNNSGVYNKTSKINTRYTDTLKKGEYKSNGFSVSIPDVSGQTNDSTIYLLAKNNDAATTRFVGRVYYCRIYDNNTLVRNFVPAKRNLDSVVGMYDTVNSVFYTNAYSSGDNFIAGAEIPHKTINLYSDSALGVNESLTVNPKTHEATKHDDTSVASLQDWDQDWKLPKADRLTVSAGTTVEPSSMEIQYYGKR